MAPAVTVQLAAFLQPAFPCNVAPWCCCYLGSFVTIQDRGSGRQADSDGKHADALMAGCGHCQLCEPWLAIGMLPVDAREHEAKPLRLDILQGPGRPLRVQST